MSDTNINGMDKLSVIPNVPFVSTSTDQFDLAFQAFLEEVQNPDKNAENPAFKSKYATLEQVLDTVKPVLKKHGLIFFQMPGFEGEVVTVTTVVKHVASGQFMGFTSASPLGPRKDPQAVGGCITYLRRYSITSAFGIIQADDDAESVKTPGAKVHEIKPTAKGASPKTVPPPPKPPAATGERERLSAKSISRWPKIQAFYREVHEMSDEQAASVVSDLRSKFAARADELAKGNAVVKLKAIIDQQNDWAMDAQFSFEEDSDA